MFNLIRKDFQVYSHILCFQLFFVIGFMTMGIYDHKANLAFLGLLIYASIIPTTILISDYRYFPLCCSLPCQRKTYVLGKYTAGFAMSLVLAGAGILYGYMMTTQVWTNTINIIPIFTIQGLTLLAFPVIVINSITFPVFFKFSKEKGFHIIIILFIFALICLLIVLVVFEKSHEGMNYSRTDVFPFFISYISEHIKNIGPNVFLAQLAGASAILLTSSIILSIRIFSRKDIGG